MVEASLFFRIASSSSSSRVDVDASVFGVLEVDWDEKKRQLEEEVEDVNVNRRSA